MAALSEKQSKHRWSNRLYVLFIGALAVLFSACGGVSGVLKPDPQVMESVFGQQPLPNHHYYHQENAFGDSGILAVDDRFTFHSRLWEPIDTNSNELPRLIKAMKQRGSRVQGFELQDRNGRRLGVLLANNTRYSVTVGSDGSFQVIYRGLTSEEQIRLLY